MSFFTVDAQEYQARRQRDFVATDITLKELRDVVPKKAFEKSTARGVYYVVRSVALVFVFFALANSIDPSVRSSDIFPLAASLIRCWLWTVYWFFQSLAGASLWVLGTHISAGHGTLSPYKWLNHALGFTLHTFILVPYFSWRWTHRNHHKASALLERDENYVPRTRSQLKLPAPQRSKKIDYNEIFEEAPICTLIKLIFMTLAGFQVYMVSNAMGSPSYPPGTNHINPWSPLFKRKHWHLILLSDLGLGVMLGVIAISGYQYGFAAVVKYYLVPYLFANHWVVILTFLQHSDPTIPHYRMGAWTFVRGSLATVDRPLLGWAGRFFLYNISHDHTAHHLFSNVPFYNLPLVTEAIKPILREQYSYDSSYTFHALWRSFTQCQFVEDDGDILLYKDREGGAARKLKNSSDSPPSEVMGEGVVAVVSPQLTVEYPSEKLSSKACRITRRAGGFGRYGHESAHISI
ncbi:fatty acid desaturase-domain-containing protein [Hysterangium stoloniferum]|nr:fatty acid desaturase-domain-containing protein [Hysterangium stoloniferum]